MTHAAAQPVQSSAPQQLGDDIISCHHFVMMAHSLYIYDGNTILKYVTKTELRPQLHSNAVPSHILPPYPHVVYCQ
jgi:hypothetical protein